MLPGHLVSSPQILSRVLDITFERLNGRVAADKRMAPLWKETNDQVIKYHPRPAQAGVRSSRKV